MDALISTCIQTVKLSNNSNVISNNSLAGFKAGTYTPCGTGYYSKGGHGKDASHVCAYYLKHAHESSALLTSLS